MSNEAVNSESLPLMDEALAHVDGELRELGLTMAVWDRSGQLKGDFNGCPLAANAVMNAAQSLRELQEIAGNVLAEGQSVQCRTACGCCVIGLPLMQRRRVVGAATVCFPVAEMAEGDCLKSLCRQTHIDKSKLKELIKAHSRRKAEDSDDLLRVLNWMLNREQSLCTANRELTNLSSNLATTYEELSLLYRISNYMNVAGRPQDFLSRVCNDLLEVIHIEAAVGVIYSHPPAVPDDITVLAGSVELNEDQIKILTATQVSPRMVNMNRPMLENTFVANVASGLGNAVKKLIAVPLMMDSLSVGMLVGLNKTIGDFDSSDLKLINAIASQASVFLNNNRLYADLQDLLMGVLHALTATIDAKDPYTCGHSQRVALLSRRIAERIDLPPRKVQQIYLSGLLHDIGKIGVPEAVLCKEGRLTNEEYDIIKRHPSIGARILQGIRQLDEIIMGILTHHERPDGRGYPQGLKGSLVPIEGLIVGLADVFDAMTSDRTYRKALKLDAVIAEIRRCAGTQFDSRLVDCFLEMDIPALMNELHSVGANQKDLFAAHLIPEVGK